MATLGQRPRHSLLEACINIFAGFWINFAANFAILPLFGFTSLTVESNLEIGLIYTLISIARQYGLRRLFNLLHVKGILK